MDREQLIQTLVQRKLYPKKKPPDTIQPVPKLFEENQQPKTIQQEPQVQLKPIPAEPLQKLLFLKRTLGI